MDTILVFSIKGEVIPIHQISITPKLTMQPITLYHQRGRWRERFLAAVGGNYLRIEFILIAQIKRV